MINAQTKSEQISRLNIKGRFSKDDLEIEITSDVEAIEINGVHGIQFYARAWKGRALGFGKDGSVETERFRIFNPPILVPDGTKRIIVLDGRNKEFDNFKEDPIEAIRQSLAHTIKVTAKDSAPIKGKIGNTTDTFYPSVDGYWQDGWDNASSWATMRAKASPSGGWSGSNDAAIVCRSYYWSGYGYNIVRPLYVFDTSSLPDGDSIDSGVFSIYTTSIDTDGDTGGSFALCQGNPTNPASIVAGDYDAAGKSRSALNSPSEGASRVAIGSITIGGYTDWTLNATGKGWVSKTGNTILTLAEGSNDIDGGTPTGGNQINGYFSGHTGTSNDPKLVVVHSVAITFTPKIIFF